MLITLNLMHIANFYALLTFSRSGLLCFGQLHANPAIVLEIRYLVRNLHIIYVTFTPNIFYTHNSFNYLGDFRECSQDSRFVTIF